MIPAPYPWRCIRLPPCPEPLRPPLSPGIPCVSYGASQKKVLFLTVLILSFTARP